MCSASKLPSGFGASSNALERFEHLTLCGGTAYGHAVLKQYFQVLSVISGKMHGNCAFNKGLSLRPKYLVTRIILLPLTWISRRIAPWSSSVITELSK